MNKFFINHLFDIFTVGKTLSKDGYCCDVSEAVDALVREVTA